MSHFMTDPESVMKNCQQQAPRAFYLADSHLFTLSEVWRVTVLFAVNIWVETAGGKQKPHSEWKTEAVYGQYDQYLKICFRPKLFGLYNHFCLWNTKRQGTNFLLKMEKSTFLKMGSSFVLSRMEWNGRRSKLTNACGYDKKKQTKQDKLDWVHCWVESWCFLSAFMWCGVIVVEVLPRFWLVN